jgi:hypothetical protein
MSQEERIRLEALNRVKRGEVTLVQVIGLSLRQAPRVWKRFRREGDVGLVWFLEDLNRRYAVSAACAGDLRRAVVLEEALCVQKSARWARTGVCVGGIDGCRSARNTPRCNGRASGSRCSIWQSPMLTSLMTPRRGAVAIHAASPGRREIHPNHRSSSNLCLFDFARVRPSRYSSIQFITRGSRSLPSQPRPRHAVGGSTHWRGLTSRRSGSGSA